MVNILFVGNHPVNPAEQYGAYNVLLKFRAHWDKKDEIPGIPKPFLGTSKADSLQHIACIFCTSTCVSCCQVCLVYLHTQSSVLKI